MEQSELEPKLAMAYVKSRGGFVVLNAKAEPLCWTDRTDEAETLSAIVSGVALPSTRGRAKTARR